MKEAYYFPHFCNARHDRKIKRILKELGIEGYGIFFMLLEVLREQLDFRYPVQDVDLLADEFGTSEQKVKAVISGYDLFKYDDENFFFSPKLEEYMQPWLSMKEQRRIAGIRSGVVRKKITEEQPLNNRSTTVEQPLNENEQKKRKEKKRKESKREEIIYTSWTNPNATQYGEFVRLTAAEFDQMICEIGLKRTKHMISSLNSYIENIGIDEATRRYKSHRVTMMTWHRKDVSEGKYNEAVWRDDTTGNASKTGFDPELYRAKADGRDQPRDEDITC